MKNKSRSLIFTLLILLITFSGLIFTSAQSEVIIKLNNTKVGFPDAKPYMDAQAGRVLVPVRFASESLGAEVKWDQKSGIVFVNEKNINKEFIIQGIGIGIYTNTDTWKSEKGIKLGMKKTEVEKLSGKSLENIRKGNTIYSIYGLDERGIYLIDNNYVSIFYDVHENNTVTSIQIIDKDIELALDGYYSEYNEKLRDDYERQVFDLANAIRVRKGLKPFTWSNKAMISSRKHNQDMADKDYFEHINLNGQSPFDRMKKEGITYILAGENIAAGTSDPIESREGWMNSIGHRENILSFI